MTIVSSTNRYAIQQVFQLRVQTPAPYVPQLLAAISQETNLAYGDYTDVSFEQTDGIQRFKSTGTGRNVQTADVVDVACSELSLFIGDDAMTIEAVLRVLYRVHPYEEPVITLTPTLRSLHVAGMDEDNPNRFWNQPVQDWVPPEHRS